MLIVQLIRSLLGYVEFTGTGGFPERFLNLCVKYRIPLWDLKNHGDSFTGKTTIHGYKSIRPAAHRSGVRLRIDTRRGLPFLTAKNKKRVGLLIGLLVAVLLVGVLSSRIWTVSVEGNDRIPEEQILAAAETLGVQMGARRKTLDTENFSEALLQKIDGLSWAALNIDSSKAIIEVRESIPKPEMADTQTPANIIAAEDGVLTKVEVYSGTAALPVDSAVLKGDLLISGVVKNLDNSETLKGAQGNVYAKVKRDMLFACPETPFMACSAVRERTLLYIFGLQIPFGRRTGDAAYTVRSYLSSGETSLPVGVFWERSAIYDSAYTLETPADKARYAVKKYAAAYKDLWAESVILETNITFDLKSEQPSVSGTILCEKEIGVNQEIFVEKISD